MLAVRHGDEQGTVDPAPVDKDLITKPAPLESTPPSQQPLLRVQYNVLCSKGGDKDDSFFFFSVLAPGLYLSRTLLEQDVEPIYTTYLLGTSCGIK